MLCVHTGYTTFIIPENVSESAMERVNFKIEKENKKEIVRYVEENNEYSSVSHFLRVAANKEMSDDEGQVELPPRVLRTLDQVIDELDEVQEGIDGIAARLDSGNRDIEMLAQNIYDSIPEAPVSNTAEAVAAGKSTQELDQHKVWLTLQNTDSPSTIPELAQSLDADRTEIKEGIRHLKSEFLPILEFVDDDGNKHFVKQEERR
jgi:hypothetical protein